MKKVIFISLLLITFQSVTFPQTKYHTEADKIVSSALTEQKGYKWLKELCDIGPRLSGSKNLEKSIEWAKDKMENAGFKVWLQPVKVPHWDRGTVESAEITESKLFEGKKLKVASLGRSIGTPKEGITAAVLEVKSFAELEQRKSEARGKIIFFNNKIDPTVINTFDAYEKAVKFRSEGALEAAKYGGAAVIIRSITTKSDDVPHVGSIKAYENNLPKLPALSLSNLGADYLSEALKKDSNLKLTIKMDCKTFADAQSYNVIGDLEGSKYPNEVVIVAGHFDSWDKGDGAHDDGGGCMQALEVLDLFKRLGIKPKRTIRCILYTNEENGVRGGTEYGQYAETSQVKHVAAIESDRGAFSPRGFTVNVTAKNQSAILKKIQSWLSVLKKAGIEWIEAGSSGVDVSKIKTAKALISYVPDSQRYFDLHHSDNDVFETVHPREMELGTAAIAILAYLISEEDLN